MNKYLNKYMGFYELKAINLPAVPWQLFTGEDRLDDNLLWTVRVAVEGSNDLNLPRAVGITAAEAVQKGRELLSSYAGKGIVIYYPYFIAQKSGVLEIDSGKTVIEAVDKDLWNLVTHGRRNVTAIFPYGISGGISTGESEVKPVEELDGQSAEKPANSLAGNETQYFGDENFLSKDEIDELMYFSSILRGKFRGELSEGSSVLVEWSYAFNTDIRHEPMNEKYLVFYELRGI